MGSGARPGSLATVALLAGAAALAGPAPARAEADGRVDVELAYLGELYVHPGGKLGATTRLLGSDRHRLFGGAAAGFYDEPQHTLTAFAGVELGYRLTFDTGVYVEALAIAAYQRMFANGPVYEVEGGVAREVTDTGEPAFMPGLGLGVGWDLSRVPGAPPFRLYVRQLGFGQYPLDRLLVMNVGAELGIALPLPR